MTFLWVIRIDAALLLLTLAPYWPSLVQAEDNRPSQWRSAPSVPDSSHQSHPDAPAPVVLHVEGVVHGFLRLTTLEGEILADGELKQSVSGERVTNELIFHFKDGSLHDETVVFSQRHKFRMLSYHLVQQGPSFKNSTKASLDGATGNISIQSGDDDHNVKTHSETLKLPQDIANGMLPILLKNIRQRDSGATVYFVALTSKPRIVKLAVSADGEESFPVGTLSFKATRYVVKFELGGIAGVIAPIVGKKPEDVYVWILRGDTPAFIKSEGPLYAGGPSWRIELASPQYKKN
jgi:hypothetical protein